MKGFGVLPGVDAHPQWRYCDGVLVAKTGGKHFPWCRCFWGTPDWLVCWFLWDSPRRKRTNVLPSRL